MPKGKIINKGAPRIKVIAGGERGGLSCSSLCFWQAHQIFEKVKDDAKG